MSYNSASMYTKVICISLIDEHINSHKLYAREKVIGVQPLPDYYETYFKKEFSIKGADLKKGIAGFLARCCNAGDCFGI